MTLPYKTAKSLLTYFEKNPKNGLEEWSKDSEREFTKFPHSVHIIRTREMGNSGSNWLKFIKELSKRVVKLVHNMFEQRKKFDDGYIALESSLLGKNCELH